jgi:AcrR family transcriptional regulator
VSSPPSNSGLADRASAAGPRERIIEATLSCFGRYGVAKTTLDDVAREARCSRATIYRIFPHGKDSVVEAVVAAEIERLFGAIAARIEGLDDLEGLLLAAMQEATERVEAHAPLQFLLAHEPGLILPHVTFANFGPLLARSADFLAPYLSPWLTGEDAPRVGEWVTRIVFSYLVSPPAARDPDATAVAARPQGAHLRHVVHDFVIPGIRELQSAPA